MRISRLIVATAALASSLHAQDPGDGTVADSARQARAAAREGLWADIARGRRDSVGRPIFEAISSARRAVALSPRDADAHYLLAATLGQRAIRSDMRTVIRAGKESYEAARRALALDSLHAGAHALLGRFHEELGGQSWIRRLTIATVSGMSAVRSASRATAEREFRTAIRLDPNSVQFHADLGRLLVRLRRIDEAEGMLRVVDSLPDRTPVDSVFRRELRSRISSAREPRPGG